MIIAGLEVVQYGVSQAPNSRAYVYKENFQSKTVTMAAIYNYLDKVMLFFILF